MTMMIGFVKRILRSTERRMPASTARRSIRAFAFGVRGVTQPLGRADPDGRINERPEPVQVVEDGAGLLLLVGEGGDIEMQVGVGLAGQ